MNRSYQSFLFNFSASYGGGGLKRLMAYSSWFNEHGGASFIVNDRLKGIDKQFPVNKYLFLRQSRFSRVINYSSQLNNLIADTGAIDLYYSYGMPLPRKVSRVSWFHLSNVLPLTKEIVPLPLKRRLEMLLLGFLINSCLKYADVISAESDTSIGLFDKLLSHKLFISVNGSDDEISAYENGVGAGVNRDAENIAVAVGTYYYKCIDDVYKVYSHLLKSNPSLRLIIIGAREYIPSYVLKDHHVVAKGFLSQSEVCDLMRRSKYYITSTIIENSYNAASEGAFLARESFISDIGPHRELLKGANYERLDNLGTRVACLHVKSTDLDPRNLKSWDQVIGEMVNLVKNDE
ncbi:MAG: glycosyltransferase [Deltaproteobacteria bacterium]|nr:glycosyltransferase [Deltaproteobacteria bacterium]